MNKTIITLTTDFSIKSPYPAVMKGVILSLNPQTQVIDLTHEIPKFDIFTASFILSYAVTYFPKGTIHVCVVDPGVGTERKGVIIKCQKGYLVGPDNGCLSLAAEKLKPLKVFEIIPEKFNISSQTFHGRDLFAPAAAYISLNKDLNEFCKPLPHFNKINFPKPHLTQEGVKGEIIFIDDFGNLVTNISLSEINEAGFKLKEKVKLRFKGKTFKTRLLETYGQGRKGELMLVLNSFNLFEISVREGNAKEKLGAETKKVIEVMK